MPTTQAQKIQAIRLTQLKAVFFKALSNPLRIQIMDALRSNELSVSELRDVLDVELPNVSQQLAVLKSSNLVLARKEGVTVYYSCTNPRIFKLLDIAKEIMNANLVDIQKTLK